MIIAWILRERELPFFETELLFAGLDSVDVQRPLSCWARSFSNMRRGSITTIERFFDRLGDT